MSLLAIFAFILRKLVTPLAILYCLQICSLLVIMLYMLFSVNNFLFYRSVISLECLLYLSHVKFLYLARLLTLGFIVRVGITL
jgi:hypothetical protein